MYFFVRLIQPRPTPRSPVLGLWNLQFWIHFLDSHYCKLGVSYQFPRSRIEDSYRNTYMISLKGGDHKAQTFLYPCQTDASHQIWSRMAKLYLSKKKGNGQRTKDDGNAQLRGICYLIDCCCFKRLLCIFFLSLLILFICCWYADMSHSDRKSVWGLWYSSGRKGPYMSLTRKHPFQ